MGKCRFSLGYRTEERQKPKAPTQRGRICLFFCLLNTIFSSVSLAALQPIPTEAQTRSLSVQLLAKRPLKARNSSKSGGIRGECPTGRKVLQALIDEKNPGLTTKDYPTFWFYLPFGQTSALRADGYSTITVTSAKFMLLDENLKPVLEKPIILPLPKQGGIVSFTLPATEKPLQIGKDYNWFFSIICDAQQPSANPTVSGWLTRVSASPRLVSQLKSTRQQDQYLAYKEANLWFDSFSQLAQYRAERLDAWSKLLKSFELQEFANETIAQLRPVGK